MSTERQLAGAHAAGEPVDDTVAGHDGADAPDAMVESEDVLLVDPAERRLPRWVVPAVVVFWSGFLGALAVRFVWSKLSGLFVLVAISAFLSLVLFGRRNGGRQCR